MYQNGVTRYKVLQPFNNIFCILLRKKIIICPCRYRIEVIVVDYTTQGHFVMFDRDVEQIVGLKASQLAQKIVEVNFIS
jgi:hypothetical protein